MNKHDKQPGRQDRAIRAARTKIDRVASPASPPPARPPAALDRGSTLIRANLRSANRAAQRNFLLKRSPLDCDKSFPAESREEFHAPLLPDLFPVKSQDRPAASIRNRFD